MKKAVWVDRAIDSRGVTVEAKTADVRSTGASVNRRFVYAITVHAAVVAP